MSELPYRVDLYEDVLGSWSFYTDSLDCARDMISQPAVVYGQVYRDRTNTLLFSKHRGEPVKDEPVKEYHKE